MKLTKNADPDKYEYSDYDIGFDACSQFSLPDGTCGKNDILFGVDNSYAKHINNNNNNDNNNNNNNILVLAECWIQGLDDNKSFFCWL